MAEITNIACRRLHPHPDNPRKELGDLTELAASIKENGIFQNLTVIPGHYLNSREYIAKCVDEGGDAAAAAAAWTPKAVWSSEDYTIIIGHRRAAAAQQAGLFEVPCVVVEMDEREQLQTMMIENMQRSDLTTYEQAQGFQLMLDLGDPEECAALALFLASGLARYITGAAIPVDGALSAGHQSISSWKHPEILTGGKLNSQSTIAALMENEAAKAIVEQYLPGFAENQQAKAAYGMTFGKIGPMLGLPEAALKALLDALDNL